MAKIVVMLGLEILIITVLVAIPGTQGSSYVVALLGQDIKYPGVAASNTIYDVILTNPGTKDVDVNISTVDGLQNKTQVAAGETKIEVYHQKHGMNGSELANKSIVFNSTDAFTLQVLIRTDTHVEGFLGLPLADLGTEYHLSTFCSISGYCQLVIAAALPETTYVHLRIPAHVDNIVFCVGQKFFRSHRDTQLILQAYEAVQVESASDMSGTYIYTSRKVAVFSGTRNMTMEGKATHLAEQLLPKDKWGLEFFLETLGNDAYGDVIQILSRQPWTGVTMKGYPNFVFTGPGQTVQRRLEPGMSTHIRANRTIQVLQVTGLANSTTGETPMPGLALVPAVTHYSSQGAVVACGTVDGEFHVVMEKVDNDKVTVDSEVFTELNAVPYTDFTIGNIVVAKTNYNVNTTGTRPFGGILTCRTGGAMAIQIDTTTPPDIPTVKKSTCIEGQWATTLFSNTRGMSRQMTPHQHALDGVDVIRLRVKTCGIAVVQLFKDTSVNRDHIMLQFYKKGPGEREIKLMDCTNDQCKRHNIIDDSYNNNLVDCNTDMAFFWIRQNGSTICVGAGPSLEPTCLASISVTWNATMLQMYGLMTDATFSYDLESGSCDKYVSEWRCQDERDDCDKYGNDMCTHPNFCHWAYNNCRKYCGKCSPDNFGRKFTVLTPSWSDRICKILVTPIIGSQLGDIAVGAATGVVSAENFDGKRYYECVCTNDISVVILISENDVSVTVLLEATNKNPIDTDTGIVSPTSPTNLGTTGGTFYAKASVFRSERPIYVYCGLYIVNYKIKDPVDHFQHVLPTYTYGKRFVTPAFEPSTVNRPFDAALFIQADRDNTVVTLDGDFHAIHPIYNRGDHIEQAIDAATVYNISSNNPVTVGIILLDAATPAKGGFFVLPPARNFPPTAATLSTTDLQTVLSEMGFNAKSATTYFVNDSGVSGTTAHYAPTVFLDDAGLWFVVPGLTINSMETGADCHVSPGEVGDGVDNDCDGLVDEDECFSGYGVYGEDMDLDGGFGEDCCCKSVATALVESPPDPMCIPFVTPDGECYKVCDQCPCPWVEELERRKQRTAEQAKQEEEADIDKYKEALKLDTETLLAEKSKVASAGDKRQSAANIGYLGIAMFAVIFGGLILMDLRALLRDFYICKANVAEGATRFMNFVRRR